MIKKLLSILSILFAVHLISFIISGCAQIGAPTGGAKDTAAPKLVKALPQPNSINFSGNKIVFSFDEFVDLQDLQNNLLISPLQKTSALITSNLKTVTVKFKDTLLPNTTYTVNFGDAIKDINEGNALKNFSYVFSTGNTIDSLELKGKILLAQTGKVDSTLTVLLYRNSPDTAVTSKKPDYISKLKGDGSFIFKNLPSDNFRIYALKDGDGNKYYNAKTETFAFSNQLFKTSEINPPVLLYAYAEKQQAVQAPITLDKKEKDKKLRYTSNLISGKQDLLEPFIITSKNGLKKIVLDSIVLCDTGYKKIYATTFKIDSTRKKIILSQSWTPGTQLKLIIYKNALEDSTGLSLSKNDTIDFAVKNTNEYGSLKLTFKNIDQNAHPLLQLLDGDIIKYNFPIAGPVWSVKMILPGEYEARLLYDLNNNGQWDPGDYSKKLQPEISVAFPQKIAVKADWDNEREIDLK